MTSSWLLLLGLALITFFNRYLFLARSVQWHGGDRLRGILKYSSYSVLTAIWFPILFKWNAEGVVDLNIDIAIGAIAAIALAVIRVNSILVLIVSALVFAAARVFL